MPPKKKSKMKRKAKKVSGRTGKPRPSKRSAKKKSVQKATKAKGRHRKKKPSVNAEAELKREFQGQDQRSGRRSTPQRSEEFEGLSRTEQADSESVDELVGEGNLFEAGAVAGVEEAEDADEKEVRTHELPQDDVPEEYREKD